MSFWRRHPRRYDRRQRIFRTILVPLDGSALAENALPFALSIAQKADATVHIVLVHVPNAYRAETAAHSEDWDLEAKVLEQNYLDALKDRLAPGCRGTIQFHHLEGVVPETLTVEVAERGVDLVVMNAHGWGYISRALLGSVSDYLIRHLNVPLLLMHAHEPTVEPTRTISFRHILIPLDGSELAETVLETAQALGGLWRSEYRLLRVVAPAQHAIGSLAQEPLWSRRRVDARSSSDAGTYLDAVAQRMRNKSSNTETQVVVSRNPAVAIVQEASTAGCDLIAISTHARGGLPRLILGSVTDKVARAAHTPVLVYPPRELAE